MDVLEAQELGESNPSSDVRSGGQSGRLEAPLVHYFDLVAFEDEYVDELARLSSAGA